MDNGSVLALNTGKLKQAGLCRPPPVSACPQTRLSPVGGSAEEQQQELEAAVHGGIGACGHWTAWPSIDSCHAQAHTVGPSFDPLDD